MGGPGSGRKKGSGGKEKKKATKMYNKIKKAADKQNLSPETRRKVKHFLNAYKDAAGIK